VSRLTEELAESRQKAEELAEQLMEAPTETVEAARTMSSEELAASYAKYRARIESLMESEREQDYLRAKALIYRFFEEGSGQAFDGLAEALQEIEVATLAYETDASERLGRQTALNEVQRYIDYLAGTSASVAAAQLAFDALVEQDLLYRRTFDGIRQLMVSSAVSAGESVVARKLLGTVTSFWLGRIRADLTGEETAAVGDSIVVKRASGDETETVVAQGIVFAVDGDVLEADIRLYFDENAPASEDLVYLESFGDD
jgi:hypothetical protein